MLQYAGSVSCVPRISICPWEVVEGRSLNAEWRAHRYDGSRHIRVEEPIYAYEPGQSTIHTERNWFSEVCKPLPLLANAIKCGVNLLHLPGTPHSRPPPNPHYLPPTLSCPIISRLLCLHRIVALRHHMYTAHPHLTTKDNGTPVRSLLPSVKKLKYQALKHFCQIRLWLWGSSRTGLGTSGL
jgi:hypothetical protein